MAESQASQSVNPVPHSRHSRSPRLGLLFDPQTSGGLLFGIDGGLAPELLQSLAAVVPVARIGKVVARREDGVLLEVV